MFEHWIDDKMIKYDRKNIKKRCLWPNVFNRTKDFDFVLYFVLFTASATIFV